MIRRNNAFGIRSWSPTIKLTEIITGSERDTNPRITKDELRLCVTDGAIAVAS